MQKVKISIVIVVSLILVSLGCDKAKEAAHEVAKVAKAGKGTPEVLKVKDLYLGMDINEVPAILRRQMPAGEKVGDVQKTENLYELSVYARYQILADENKKVVRIMFAFPIINHLFNVEDLSAEAFAHNFIEAYSIPEMKARSDGEGWEYTNSIGYKVTIYDTKNLVIEKVASADERKFD